MSHRFPRVLVPIVLLSALTAQAQPRGDLRVRPIYVPERPFSVSDAVVYHDRVVIKFRERIAVRLVDDKLVCLDGLDLRSVTRVLRKARVERLFTRPVAALDRERAERQDNVPANEEPLADLNNYYRVWTSGARETERLVNVINDDPLIETAYAEFIPMPAEDISPPTPSFESRQSYLGSSPTGLNYWQFESIVGARFQNGRMAHLEAAWIVDHEDCRWLRAGNFVGLPPTPALIKRWTNHGAACVGVMAAGRNGYGVRGLASDTLQMFLVSMSNGGANMVDLAAARLGAGDVMSSSFVYQWASRPEILSAPRDFPQADWDAVRSAATKGIHYTFCAGNSGKNIETDPRLMGRYAPSALSSGGYIIGATEAGQATRASFSNWGPTHVIASAQGKGVVSIGWGALFSPNNDPRQFYTSGFAGTSAAAPQVAGVIASFTGAVREQSGRTLSISEVKAALRSTGASVTGGLGNRPDVGELLGLYNLPDGLLVTAHGQPGGSWTYQVTGNRSEPVMVFLSTSRGNFGTNFNRSWLLGLGQSVVLESFTLESKVTARTIPIPNEPLLRNMDFFMQTISIRASHPYLSNSATLWIQ